MLRFILTVCAVGVAFWIALIANESLHLVLSPSFGFTTLLFVAVVTVVIFVYVSKEKLRDYFLQTYLLSMVVKMIACSAYAFIIVIKDRPGAFGNVVFFLATYVVFTALEIAFLYRGITRPGRRP